MFKRILKILAIVLASFVVAGGVGVGFFAINGGFSKEEIGITKLYFDDDSSSIYKEIYTLDDITTRIKYEPANATNKTLKVTINDNNIGVLQDPPTQLTAGEDFTLHIRKDSKGNNVGGVVSIIAQQGIARVELKVAVDVAIPDNSLYFSGDYSNTISTTGKSFKMAVHGGEEYVYLKSTLVNAFYLTQNNVNLKSAEIECSYYDKHGAWIKNENLTNRLQVGSVYNALENCYNYFYKIPVTPTSSGTIEISARMHRNYQIQKDFEEIFYNGSRVLSINEIKTYLNNSATAVVRSQYLDFLNKYIGYINGTPQSEEFFSQFTVGLVTMSNAQLANSVDYVFVTCSATIDITAIKLDKITTTLDPVTYTLENNLINNERFYSVNGNDIAGKTNVLSLKDVFNLKVTVDNEEGIEDDETEIYDSLKVSSYMYLDKNSFADEDFTDGGISWAGRVYQYISVYGFKDNIPLFDSAKNELSGYLLKFTLEDEYIFVKQLQYGDKKYWKISYNVPLQNDNSTDITKALYLNFNVQGIDLDKNEVIVRDSYVRVFVDFVDYEFDDEQISNLNFQYDNLMTINTSLAKTNYGSNEDKVLTSGLNTQEIELDNSKVVNIEDVTYKRIMYFVEAESNVVNESSKIVSVGKYRFINYSNANNSESSDIYYTFGNEGEVLVGERIPTNNDGTYFLQAINASLEPVKIFAVSYLCDKNGNPIDVNGRKLTIDEMNPGDESSYPALVVLRISDISTTMPEITIKSFVDTINFYTTNEVASIERGGKTINSGYLKRNFINSAVNDANEDIDDNGLLEIQDFLRIKLLKNNNFILYMTCFDLDANGSVSTEENTYISMSNIKDVFGKSFSDEITYSIDIMNNKQLAFNALCDDFSNYNLQTTGDSVNIVKTDILAGNDVWTEEDDATKVRFVINTNSDERTGVIYLNPVGSSIPYAIGLTPNDGQSALHINYVEYMTSKLQVTDLELKDTDTFKVLHARYKDLSSDNTNTPGEIYFADINGDGDSSEYKLNLENGEIGYTVFTNLKNGEDVNLDIVDCSQASDTEIILPDGFTAGDYYYENLQSYISYYVNDTNNKKITYKNPEQLKKFVTDVVFTNIYNGKVYDTIFIGQNAYVYNEIARTIDIDGRTLPIVKGSADDEYNLILPAGSIYPVINNGNTLLVLGEEFYIDGGQIHTYKEIGSIYSVVSVDSNEYNPDNYIDDSSTKVAGKAITVNGDTATVNFIQGKDGGVVAYVLVSFNMIRVQETEGYEASFTKALTYNLVQETIELTGYNLNKNDVPEVNDETHRMIIDAGKKTTIGLFCGGESVVAPQSIVASVNGNNNFSDSNFLQHLKFSSTLNTVTLQRPADNYSSLDIIVPHMVCDSDSPFAGHFEIEVEYKFKYSTDQHKYTYSSTEKWHYYISIKGDVGLGFNGDNVKTGNDGNESFYQISLESNTSISFDELFASGVEARYFIKNILENNNNIDYCTLELGNTNFAEIQQSNRLVVKTVYAVDGETYPSFFASIKIHLNSGEVINSGMRLKVNIIPSYIIKFEDNIEIYNGQTLFGSYIKLFDGHLSVSDLIDSNVVPYDGSAESPYNSIFTISGYTNGEITRANDICSDEIVNIDVRYNQGNSIITKSMSVNIIGVTLQYSYVGDVANNAIMPNDGNGNPMWKNIELYVRSGDSINIEDYIKITDEDGVDIDNIVPILVNSENVSSIYLNNVTINSEYFIAYGVLKNAIPNIIEKTIYKVYVYVVNMTYSEIGDLENNSTSGWNNIDIEVTSGQSIDVADYVSVTTSGKTLSAVLIDNSGTMYRNVNVITSDKTYNIAYCITDLNSQLVLVGKTNYTFAITIV